MEVILLEKHQKLGNIGNTVAVKNGYARNYLIPNKKAIRATAENKKFFEIQKESIQKEFESKRTQAEAIAKTLEGKTLTLVRACGEDSRLYGSVSANDLVKAIKDQHSQELQKSSITLIEQIKYTGIYNITANVFADITFTIKLSIGRSEEEAKEELKNESANKLKREAEKAKAEAELAPANIKTEEAAEEETKEIEEEISELSEETETSEDNSSE